MSLIEELVGLGHTPIGTCEFSDKIFEFMGNKFMNVKDIPDGIYYEEEKPPITINFVYLKKHCAFHTMGFIENKEYIVFMSAYVTCKGGEPECYARICEYEEERILALKASLLARTPPDTRSYRKTDISFIHLLPNSIKSARNTLI